jgi:hypothetical protein
MELIGREFGLVREQALGFRSQQAFDFTCHNMLV